MVLARPELGGRPLPRKHLPGAAEQEGWAATTKLIQDLSANPIGERVHHRVSGDPSLINVHAELRSVDQGLAKAVGGMFEVLADSPFPESFDLVLSSRVADVEGEGTIQLGPSEWEEGLRDEAAGGKGTPVAPSMLSVFPQQLEDLGDDLGR